MESGERLKEKIASAFSEFEWEPRVVEDVFEVGVLEEDI